MDCNRHAAFWSDSPSHQENRYRITHHKGTKQRVNKQEQREEMRNKDFWTWEEILDGRGPWAKPGECSRPKGQREKKQPAPPKEEYSNEYTTWEEIDRGAADPGRVPEPAWDSMEQCAEGYRRMEFAKQARRRGRRPHSHPQKFLGGGAQGECGRVRRQT